MVSPSFLFLNARADALEARVGSAVRALFADALRGPPEPIGSCVVIEIGPRWLLLTAAHVFREAGNRPILVAGEEDFVEVPTRRFQSIDPLSRVAGADPFDIGFFEVPDEARRNFGQVRPIQLSEVDWTAQSDSRAVFVAMGYPIKRTRFDSNGLLVEYSLARMTAFEKPQAITQLKLLSQTHVSLGFDRKRTFVNGVKQPAIKPNGMSGGGLWRFDSFFYPEPVASEAKLAGILIEYYEHEVKAMIATRTHVVLQTVAAVFPDLAPMIEAARRAGRAT